MQIKLNDKQRQKPINDPQLVADMLHDTLSQADIFDRHKEHLWGIYFDNRNKIKRVDLLGIGTLNASLVHPREVLVIAIKSLAASFMIAHNHPSGVVTPSESDTSVTKRMAEAGGIIGITFLDHLIIDGKGGYYSFRENKLL
jgi:DNA repair protein RadC